MHTQKELEEHFGLAIANDPSLKGKLFILPASAESAQLYKGAPLVDFMYFPSGPESIDENGAPVAGGKRPQGLRLNYNHEPPELSSLSAIYDNGKVTSAPSAKTLTLVADFIHAEARNATPELYAEIPAQPNAAAANTTEQAPEEVEPVAPEQIADVSNAGDIPPAPNTEIPAETNAATNAEAIPETQTEPEANPQQADTERQIARLNEFYQNLFAQEDLLKEAFHKQSRRSWLNATQNHTFQYDAFGQKLKTNVREFADGQRMRLQLNKGKDGLPLMDHTAIAHMVHTAQTKGWGSLKIDTPNSNLKDVIKAHAIIQGMAVKNDNDTVMSAEDVQKFKDSDIFKSVLAQTSQLYGPLLNIDNPAPLTTTATVVNGGLATEPATAPELAEQVVEQPVIEQPVIEQPVAEQPAAEQPVIEQPAAEQPVIEEPAAPPATPIAEATPVETPVVDEAIPPATPIAEAAPAEHTKLGNLSPWLFPATPIAEATPAEQPVAEDAAAPPAEPIADAAPAEQAPEQAQAPATGPAKQDLDQINPAAIFAAAGLAAQTQAQQVAITGTPYVVRNAADAASKYKDYMLSQLRAGDKSKQLQEGELPLATAAGNKKLNGFNYAPPSILDQLAQNINGEKYNQDGSFKTIIAAKAVDFTTANRDIAIEVQAGIDTAKALSAKYGRPTEVRLNAVTRNADGSENYQTISLNADSRLADIAQERAALFANSPGLQAFAPGQVTALKALAEQKAQPPALKTAKEVAAEAAALRAKSEALGKRIADVQKKQGGIKPAGM